MRVNVLYETVDGSGGEKPFDSTEEAEEFVAETKAMGMGAKIDDRNSEPMIEIADEELEGAMTALATRFEAERGYPQGFVTCERSGDGYILKCTAEPQR